MFFRTLCICKRLCLAHFWKLCIIVIAWLMYAHFLRYDMTDNISAPQHIKSRLSCLWRRCGPVGNMMAIYSTAWWVLSGSVSISWWGFSKYGAVTLFVSVAWRACDVNNGRAVAPAIHLLILSYVQLLFVPDISPALQQPPIVASRTNGLMVLDSQPSTTKWPTSTSIVSK